MEIKADISKAHISESDIDQYREKAKSILDELWSGLEEYTGWVKLPIYFKSEDMDRIIATAEEIRQQCDYFIVIGIGGSYLGAKAAISALAGDDDGVEIEFAGTNFSSVYHRRLLDKLAEKNTCICVISKSGSTAETDVAYNIFKKAMTDKYGEEAKERIYVITGEKGSALREETEREGYVSFPVPEDIGGRYSVLSEVGLLPMAVAGIDIKAMLRGAEAAAGSEDRESTALSYGIARYILKDRGKAIETFLYYEPSLMYFVEWAKQLFAESEGKNGLGIFPAGLGMTGDLHSLGQFLQEGNQIFFETVLDIEKSPEDIVIPGGNYAGKTMAQFNRAAVEGVMEAHRKADIPIIKITIPELTAYHYGQLIYFCETSCAITAKLTGVNPFDQPGVEKYKAEMKKIIR